MVQTMAVSSDPGTLRWLKKEVLLKTMDWLNVMTYDYSGEWTPYAGHNSPLFASTKPREGKPRSTELTMKYLVNEHGLPPDRLAVGIPLYGRGFAVAEPYASTRGAGSAVLACRAAITPASRSCSSKAGPGNGTTRRRTPG